MVTNFLSINHYLTNVIKESGKENTIARKLFKTIKKAELHRKLMTGSDGRNTRTGSSNRTISKLEVPLNLTPQWDICFPNTH